MEAWNNGDPDPKKANKYGDRERDARDELPETAPTTLQGLLALLTYINGVTRGEFSPSGRPDNAFETSDNLMDVLAGAEKFLAKQIGRARDNNFHRNEYNDIGTATDERGSLEWFYEWGNLNMRVENPPGFLWPIACVDADRRTVLAAIRSKAH